MSQFEDGCTHPLPLFKSALAFGFLYCPLCGRVFRDEERYEELGDDDEVTMAFWERELGGDA